MFKNFFSLFKKNGDPYILDKTEVKKEHDSDSEQIYYLKSNHFTDKRDKNGMGWIYESLV